MDCCLQHRQRGSRSSHTCAQAQEETYDVYMHTYHIVSPCLLQDHVTLVFGTRWHTCHSFPPCPLVTPCAAIPRGCPTGIIQGYGQLRCSSLCWPGLMPRRHKSCGCNHGICCWRTTGFVALSLVWLHLCRCSSPRLPRPRQCSGACTPRTQMRVTSRVSAWAVKSWHTMKLRGL